MMNKFLLSKPNRHKYPDYNLLSDDKSKLYDFDLFNINNIPDGRFKLRYRGIIWECLWKSHKSRNLIVSFSGSNGEKGRKTTFARWSWYEQFKGNFLAIDDPMYSLHNVTIGWYYGDNENDYVDYMSDIIDKIKKDIVCNDITFYGSSAGGTAAIRCANKLHYGTVIVINPQLRIEYYPFKEEIESIIGCSMCNDYLLRDNVIEEMTANINNNVKYLLIDNLASELDRVQLAELLRVYSRHKIQYGLNYITDNVLLWIYEAEHADPHQAQEWKSFLPSILYVSNLFKKNKIIDNDLMLSLNELWYDHYKELLIKNINKKLFSERKVVEFLNDADSDYDDIWQKKVTFVNKNNNWYSYKLPLKNVCYKISLNTVLSHRYSKYVYALYDNNTGEIIKRCEISASDNFQHNFAVDPEYNNISLCVYIPKEVLCLEDGILGIDVSVSCCSIMNLKKY